METQTQNREALQIGMAAAFQGSSLPAQAIFRKEGEYWSVGYTGKLFSLKDTKGLGYLAHLLRHPATEFHVLDLAGGIATQHEDEANDSARGWTRGKEDLAKAGIHIASLGDAGEMLDEQAQAKELYPLVDGLLDTGAVVLWPISRYTRTIAGVAAAAAHEWEAAQGHFQIAMKQAEAFPNLLEQAEIRRFHAMMLLDRAATDDRDKAQTLASEALETYTQIGMPHHIRMSQALFD